MKGTTKVRLLVAMYGNSPRGHLPGDVIHVNDDIARRFLEDGWAELADEADTGTSTTKHPTRRGPT
jgi:hypothetical protein